MTYILYHVLYENKNPPSTKNKQKEKAEIRVNSLRIMHHYYYGTNTSEYTTSVAFLTL